MLLVAVSIISSPTASVCVIRSSTPKACALPPALSKPDAKWPLVRASNVPACTGPSKAPTPSLLSVVQNSVVVFKISGNADQNAGSHDPSLSWRAPVTLAQLYLWKSITWQHSCLRRTPEATPHLLPMPYLETVSPAVNPKIPRQLPLSH